MNRHQSNPFLSNWDDDLADMHTQTNAHLFDTATPMLPDSNTTTANETATGGNGGGGQPRRSSCSQAESSSNSNSPGRPSLYRRNMSSFEAASLQLEQHQQQMLENGSSVLDTQKDLIAKMTADFQSAIQTNDKQFEDLSFNPFDPFETIVDDDGLSSPAPSSFTDRAQTKFDMNLLERDNDGENADFDGTKTQEEAEAHQQQQRNNQTHRTHDSIDDDEDDLVSTPVRNIKSLSNADSNRQSSPDDRRLTGLDGSDCSRGDESNGAPPQTDEPNSITKASMFASLLASAESSNQQQDHAPSVSPMNDDGTPYEEGHDLEATANVIKGSPNSMGDGNDRSVSFFDPFETVIDKDALTSLVSESYHHTQQHQQATPATPKLDRPLNLHAIDGGGSGSGQHERVAESASIETVIENQTSTGSANSVVGGGAHLDSSSVAAPSSNGNCADDDTNNHLHEETSGPESVSGCGGGVGGDGGGDGSGSGQLAIGNETAAASSTSDLHYDSSAALERPMGRRPEQSLSGIAPPQPTPAKRSAARVQRKKASFQEDSSDSSEEDDRIQIVIRARDTSKPDELKGTPTVVPLLPPPPSKSSMKQARERGQVEDMPSPIMGYKSRKQRLDLSDDDEDNDHEADRQASGIDEPRHGKPISSGPGQSRPSVGVSKTSFVQAENADEEPDTEDGPDDDENDGGQFVIPMTHSDDDGDTYGKCDTPLYDDDTSYVLDDYPQKYDGPGWEMMLRYPPKKKLTTNRFWKKIFVKLAQVPSAPDRSTTKANAHQQPPPNSTTNNNNNNNNNEGNQQDQAALCWVLQIYDHQEDKKPMQEIPIQATYTVSEISSQLFDQFGKIFTIKLQYIFYKERVGVRQGQLARFIHTGHIGSSTTSGGHGVDPISIGAIKRMGAPIEHSPQISQIIKLGCVNYDDIKQFKEALEDCLFRMPIHRDRALTTYKTEEVQMAVRDETYIEISQIGTVTKQLARVRLFFLSFLNGMPIVEVGINDFHRQGREVVGRMDILPVVTEEWIRLEAWELHSTVAKEDFENPDSRIIKLSPPDATFFELMRFRIRPPRNRELPLQISANMSVTRTRVSINCEVMVPGCVSRKHGQIPCENIAIRVHIPECWVYFFREEKHFRMGSKKSVNRRPGKVKGIERFLGGGGLQNDFNDESSLIEVTSGQAKYEHHHHSVVWRAARWPKETQSAYVQNTMKIRLPLTAYDKMPENFYEFVHAEYTMPATTVSHTTLRSISVNPYEDEPPEKYVKYAAKYEYKVKMRLSVNLGGRSPLETGPEVSPIVIMKQPDLQDDLQREEDSDDDDDDDDDDVGNNNAGHHSGNHPNDQIKS